jgi:PIN domain nuclease of toxin-antitoxin system
VSDEDIVVDASAVLAVLRREPFERFDPDRLAYATISAINFSEVLERLYRGGASHEDADRLVNPLSLNVVPFDDIQARAVARLRGTTRHVGLSLADRACLALGLQRGEPVVTADRVWATLDIGVEVILIR